MDTHTETLLGPNALRAEATTDSSTSATTRHLPEEPIAHIPLVRSGRREGTFVRTGGTRPRLAHTLDTPALRAARKGGAFPRSLKSASNGPSALRERAPTILYDVLALDPASRPPLEWEAQLPWPPRRRRPTRRTSASRWSGRRRPGARRRAGGHHRHPSDESRLPQMQHSYATTSRVPTGGRPLGWTRMVATRHADGCYRTHRRFLQHLQWHGPRSQLDAAPHPFDLEGLLDTYPDACRTRRRPASLASCVPPLPPPRGRRRRNVRMGDPPYCCGRTGAERGVISRDDPRSRLPCSTSRSRRCRTDPRQPPPGCMTTSTCRSAKPTANMSAFLCGAQARLPEGPQLTPFLRSTVSTPTRSEPGSRPTAPASPTSSEWTGVPRLEA